MPIKRREPKRRLEDPEFAAIRAGLLGEPCPPGSNAFAHLSAEFARRRSPGWPRIVAVFRELPWHERHEIIIRRRRDR